MVEESRLPPPDRGGPFGMSFPQIATIIISVLAVFLMLRSSHYTLAMVYSTAAVLLMARFGGVHGYQWAYTLIRVTRIFLRGGITYRSRARLDGFTNERPEIMDEVRQIVGGRLEFPEFLYRGGGLCLTHNRDTGIASAAFKSRGTNFLTQDEPNQRAFNNAFGTLLDNLGNGSHPVAMYKWTHRTTAATTASTELYNREKVDQICYPGEETARLNLAAAQHQNIVGATNHDIEQVIGLSPRVSSMFRRNYRMAGGGLRNLYEQLLPHINSLVDDLVAMGVREVQPLGREAMHLQLERSFGGELKQIDESELELLRELDPGLTVELTGGLPFYLYLPRHQRWVIVNGRYAKSLYIPGYSKLPVDPHHLAAQLNVHGVTRAVTVIGRPKKPGMLRQISDEITASVGEGMSDRRATKGVRERDTHITRAAWLRRREKELNNGHSDWLWSGYITVWADSLPELDASVELVRQQAKESKLPRLHTMWGWQLEGVMFTSPLAAG